MWCSWGTFTQAAPTWLEPTRKRSGCSRTWTFLGSSETKWTRPSARRRAVLTTGVYEHTPSQWGTQQAWKDSVLVCFRIVVHGESFLKTVSPHSARVFRVNKELRIPTSVVRPVLISHKPDCLKFTHSPCPHFCETSRNFRSFICIWIVTFVVYQVLAISDHFPIEVVLKSSAHLLQATTLLALVSVSAIVCSFLPALWSTALVWSWKSSDCDETIAFQNPDKL